jgi:His-Xaa-Ser system protein HxsD
MDDFSAPGVHNPAIASNGIDVLEVCVDTDLYTREALFRACYQFTERCFLYLRHGPGNSVVVEFRRRHPEADLADIAGSFANELINQRVRAGIARETQHLREMIVAHAFAPIDVPSPSP